MVQPHLAGAAPVARNLPSVHHEVTLNGVIAARPEEAQAFIATVLQPGRYRTARYGRSEPSESEYLAQLK